MITIYNESRHKDKRDDSEIRSLIENYFDEHEYLDFTNVLVWIKESNPSSSRGQELYECSIEARLPNQEPVYVSKKNSMVLNGVREALDTVKDEIIRKRERIRDRNHPGEARL